MRLHLAFAAAAAASCLASPASAALLARPGGVFYDTVLDITWSGDANFAKTFYDARGISHTGLVGLAEATFLTNFHFYENPATGAIYQDWRLPTLGPDVGAFDPYLTGYDGQLPSGQGAVGTGWGTPDDSGIYSELGWMFYANLGGFPRCMAAPTPGGSCGVYPNYGLPRDANGYDTGPFANLQIGHYATQAQVRHPDTGNEHQYWNFDMRDGFQTPRSVQQTSYVWLVHDGDIGAAPTAAVPEPATWALLIAGFGATGAALRRRRAATASPL